MITNDKIYKLCTYALPTNLTDHYPTLCMIGNLTIGKNTAKNVPSIRDRKSFNSEIFCDELGEKLEEMVSNNLPLNHAIFNSVFISKKPLIIKGILTSIRLKNFIFRSHFINGTEKDKPTFDAI